MLVYVANGPQQVRVAAEVGEILPGHAAAGSKCVLAFASPEIRAIHLNGEFPAYTPNTIVDPDEFQRHLMEVGRLGYATDLEEIDIGISAVAVPIFDFTEQPKGAVVVVGPSARIPGEDITVWWAKSPTPPPRYPPGCITPGIFTLPGPGPEERAGRV